MDTVRSRGIFIFLHSSSGKKDNKRDCGVNDSRLKGFENRVYIDSFEIKGLSKIRFWFQRVTERSPRKKQQKVLFA